MRHSASTGGASPYWEWNRQVSPETVRRFEESVSRLKNRHNRILAARRHLARAMIGQILRMAVKQRAIALHWQEQTQRALCAPSGAGRAADAVAFESEFA